MRRTIFIIFLLSACSAFSEENISYKETIKWIEKYEKSTSLQRNEMLFDRALLKFKFAGIIYDVNDASLFLKDGKLELYQIKTYVNDSEIWFTTSSRELASKLNIGEVFECYPIKPRSELYEIVTISPIKSDRLMFWIGVDESRQE